MMQQNQQQAQAERLPPAASNGQPDDDTPLRVVPDLPVFGGDV